MNISIQDLSHTYDALPAPIEALSSVSLQIPSGQFAALIGPSGCGKSTVLRLLAGLLKPNCGMIYLDDFPPPRAIAQKRVAWMAQSPALLPWKTARDNIELAQRVNPQPRRNSLSSDELLNLIDLADFADVYPFSLSGGMQQRVALARSLALNASVWLMDEPFASLDELTRESLAFEVIRLWHIFRVTVLWVTHNIYESVRLADRIMVMSPRPGHIHADIEVPLSRPRDETSTEFLAIVKQIRAALKAE